MNDNNLIEKCLDIFSLAEQKNVDGILEHLDENVVWRNMPLPRWMEVRSREGARKQINLLFKVFRSFTVGEHIHLSQDENIVYSERVEIFGLPGGLEFRVPAMSVFVFENGKIVEWRDYFDNFMLAGGFVVSLPWQILKKFRSNN